VVTADVVFWLIFFRIGGPEDDGRWGWKRDLGGLCSKAWRGAGQGPTTAADARFYNGLVLLNAD